MALANPYNYKKPQGFVAQPRTAIAKKGPIEVPKSKHDAYLEQKIMAAIRRINVYALRRFGKVY